MDRELIIRLAREAGLYPHVEWGGMFYVTSGFLEDFAAIVAAHERDRICTMLDDLHKQEERHNYYGFIRNMIREMK